MVTGASKAIPDAVRAALAAAGAILLGCLAACGSPSGSPAKAAASTTAVSPPGRPAPPVSPPARLTPPGSPGATRTARWDVVRFDLPATWTARETHEAAHPHPSNALLEGPYLGTLRTGPMCWSNRDGSGGCSRAHGILQRRPTGGIVAWIDGAPLSIPGRDVDPGPAAAGTCPPHGLTFHAYRSVPTQDGRYRVSLDGCAYGPHAQEYLAQLRAVAASLRAS